MQVNLEKDGTFIFTTDQYHIKENSELSHPHGWLARDHNAWIRSHNMIKQLTRLFNATLVFGHDMECYQDLVSKKQVWE